MYLYNLPDYILNHLLEGTFRSVEIFKSRYPLKLIDSTYNEVTIKNNSLFKVVQVIEQIDNLPKRLTNVYEAPKISQYTVNFDFDIQKDEDENLILETYDFNPNMFYDFINYLKSYFGYNSNLDEFAYNYYLDYTYESALNKMINKETLDYSPFYNHFFCWSFCFQFSQVFNQIGFKQVKYFRFGDYIYNDYLDFVSFVKDFNGEYIYFKVDKYFNFTFYVKPFCTYEFTIEEEALFSLESIKVSYETFFNTKFEREVSFLEFDGDIKYTSLRSYIVSSNHYEFKSLIEQGKSDEVDFRFYQVGYISKQFVERYLFNITKFDNFNINIKILNYINSFLYFGFGEYLYLMVDYKIYKFEFIKFDMNIYNYRTFINKYNLFVTTGGVAPEKYKTKCCLSTCRKK